METLKTALDWIQKLETLPAGALTIVVCIALGYVLKLVPEFPNARIPLVNLIAGGLFYMLVTPYASASPLVVLEHVPLGDRVRAFGIGLVLGAAAWLLHNQVLKRIEDSDLLARVLPSVSGLLAAAKTNPPPAAPPPAEAPKTP
jgi:hypothetical protein